MLGSRKDILEEYPAMWEFDTWYSHAHQTHAAAESPGQEAGAGLGVGPHVVLAVVAGQVHRPVVQLSRNHQRGRHGGRSLVDRTNICQQQSGSYKYSSWKYNIIYNNFNLILMIFNIFIKVFSSINKTNLFPSKSHSSVVFAGSKKVHL